MINNLKHAGQHHPVNFQDLDFKRFHNGAMSCTPYAICSSRYSPFGTPNESSNSVKLVGGDLARKARKTNLVSVCQRSYTDVLQVYCRRKRRKNKEELEKIGNRKP